MKRGDFPVQGICDLDKPDEAFAWTLVALPKMNGAALPMSSEYMQMVSKHLWDCGARIPHTREGKVKFQRQWWHAPGAGNPHWLTSPGFWKDTPPDPNAGPNMVDVLNGMKKADERGFFNALDQVMREEND